MPLPTAERLSSAVEEAIQAMSRTSERSMQSVSGEIGISDIGHCREYLRRSLLEEPFSDVRDTTTAWLGTAVGDHAEQAFVRKFPNAKRHVEVTARIPGFARDAKGQVRLYVVSGHPDILVVTGPSAPGVIDFKSVNGTATVRRSGPSDQQEFQVDIYAYGAWQMGLFGEAKLEDVWVSDVWIDRSGREKQVHSNPHMFDPEKIEEAGRWLDDVLYALDNKQEAERDQRIEWCADYCERYTACRLGERPIGGIITAPHLVEATRLLRDSKEMAKVAKNWDEEARAVLLHDARPGHEGISGTVDGEPIRVTWVNGTDKKVGGHRINSG